MRKLVLALLAGGALASSAVLAAPVALPGNTPLFLQYVNAEQISLSNSISDPSGGPSMGNWGIVQITDIAAGTVLAPTGSDIQGGGTTIFHDNLLPAGAQILGMFYGADFGASATGAIATGGKLDLYYWDPGHTLQNTGTELASGTNLAKRTATNEYTGYTCASGNTSQCTLLAEFDFVSGSDPGAPGVTIVTPTVPGTTDGTSKSYLSVDTTKVGAWTSILDTNFFTLDPCNNPVGHTYAAGGEPCISGTVGPGINPGYVGGVSYPDATDIRLDNNFSRSGATAWDVAGTDIIGLRSNDPARAFTVPEPESVALLGLTLAIGGWFGRRRQK